MSSLFTVPELAIGVGLSEAASAAFEPKVEVPKQQAWANNPQRVPDLGLIAELIAGGKVTMTDGQNMANRLGFSNGTMESLVWLTQNRLDFSVMLRLWRRFGAFDASADATLSDLFDKTIAHERLDWDYREWLRNLKTAELIGIGDIATAIVRGAVPAPSWVPVAPPTTTDHVPRFPVTDIDPVKLAAALGFNEDMLRIMTARSGLSLAPILATQANFRGVLTDNDWLLAIAEGDLRTEWADTLREAARQILTAGEYAELQLRGFYDRATRLTHTRKHGMTDADSDLLYDVLGRAPGIHAVTTGLARGGTYDGKPKTIPEPFLSAVERANIRPEWYDIEYANRFTYPTGFQIKSEAPTDGYDWVYGLLLEVGWKPELAAHYAAKWSGGTTATPKADPHVGKAQTQLWTTTHKSYLDHEATVQDATDRLTLLGIDTASQSEILSLWDSERALIRKGLTAKEIVKALGKGLINPATQAPWTVADAEEAIVALGYDQADAQTLTQE